MAHKVSILERTVVDGKEKYLVIEPDVNSKGEIRTIAQRVQKGNFYITWYEDGKKKTKSVGNGKSLGQAYDLAQAKNWQLQNAAKGHVIPDPTVDNNRLTIAAAMTARLADIKLTWDNGTYVAHNDAYTDFNKWNAAGPGRVYVDQIIRTDLLTFKKSLIDRGLAERTAGRKMMDMNSMIKVSLKLKDGEGPVSVKDARYKEEPVEIYEEEELTKFFAACNFFQKVLFKTFEKTGFRMQEVMFLDWKDINFKDRRITVRGKKLELNGKKYEFKVKAESARTIAVPSDLIQMLEEWRKVSKSTCTLVFPTKNCQPNDKMLQACKRIAVRAGLAEDSFYLHKFRATYATRLLRKGIDIPTVRFLLGHKPDSDSIWRYVAAMKNDQVADKLEAALADATV